MSLRLSVLPGRAAPETIGLPLPRTGPLPEKLNPPNPGSARSIVNYTTRASPGGVKSHHTGLLLEESSPPNRALPETIVRSHKIRASPGDIYILWYNWHTSSPHGGLMHKH